MKRFVRPSLGKRIHSLRIKPGRSLGVTRAEAGAVFRKVAGKFTGSLAGLRREPLNLVLHAPRFGGGPAESEPPLAGASRASQPPPDLSELLHRAAPSGQTGFPSRPAPSPRPAPQGGDTSRAAQRSPGPPASNPPAPARPARLRPPAPGPLDSTPGPSAASRPAPRENPTPPSPYQRLPEMAAGDEEEPVYTENGLRVPSFLRARFLEQSLASPPKPAAQTTPPQPAPPPGTAIQRAPQERAAFPLSPREKAGVRAAPQPNPDPELTPPHISRALADSTPSHTDASPPARFPDDPQPPAPRVERPRARIEELPPRQAVDRPAKSAEVPLTPPAPQEPLAPPPPDPLQTVPAAPLFEEGPTPSPQARHEPPADQVQTDAPPAAQSARPFLAPDGSPLEELPGESQPGPVSHHLPRAESLDLPSHRPVVQTARLAAPAQLVSPWRPANPGAQPPPTGANLPDPAAYWSAPQRRELPLSAPRPPALQRSVETHTAAAPLVQRAVEPGLAGGTPPGAQPAPSAAPGAIAQPGPAAGEPGQTPAAPNLDEMARQVYVILRRRLQVEQERARGTRR